MSVRKRKGLHKRPWQVDYRDGSGKRRSKQFVTKKEADAFSATATVEVREGVHVPDEATVSVAKAGELWIASGKVAGLERTTIDQQQQHLKLHMIPFIGAVKLNKLNVPAVRAFQDRLRQEGRSLDMVKRVTVSLGSIMADAQERGLLARNFIRDMPRSRAEKRNRPKLRIGVDIPTPAEINAIIANATEPRWRALLLTVAFTGLRGSEIRGLEWDAIEFLPPGEGAVIHVRQRADRYKQIGMPKSEAGHRSIPVGPLVANTLREWQLCCPRRDTGRRDADGRPIKELRYVFPNGAGNIEDHTNIVTRGLVPAVLAAGLTVPVLEDDGSPRLDEQGQPAMKAKYTGLHCFRHFFVSWCANRKVDGGRELSQEIVRELTGHSSQEMTNIYSHLFPRRDDSEERAAAERAVMTAVATGMQHQSARAPENRSRSTV